jgi:translation initiation factor IF-2
MAVLAGRAIAPVRIMEDHLGKPLKEATFSTPVSLTGFDELPGVGETFRAYKNKREAEAAREQMAPAAAPAALAEAGEGQYSMPVIVRADTTGSLEAILQETAHIGDQHGRVTVVQSGIGTISEGDVKTALAGDNRAIVVGFNVRIDPVAEALARERGVRIELFNIIYKLTEKLEEFLKESAPKRTVEEVVGRAKIVKVFSSRKDEHVIGGGVLEGYLAKNGTFRIIRRNVLIGTGKFKNIQTNKQNVERAEASSEFGAQVEAAFEPAQGDVIECIVTTTV